MWPSHMLKTKLPPENHNMHNDETANKVDTFEIENSICLQKVVLTAIIKVI